MLVYQPDKSQCYVGNINKAPSETISHQISHSVMLVT
jgi:hypothetical protein